MPVLCNNAPAGSHLEGMLAALWNGLPRDLGFRGGQRRTTQTIPLRFAAATLLRYCAYSIETQLTALPRPLCIEPMHPRTKCPPLSWGLGPRS